ncbi:MAG TPA: 2,3-diphosphoglycerate-dependent phosphoglycerate mutase [Acidimicrobiia bacterium]|jgi:2,3-bisphosphoglycerate-dependent phosphoglycerate mutase
MTRLMLLRHGESVWNLENVFTGWTDVELSDRGVAEAREAGRLMQAEGFTFDLAFTSVLRRAVDTLHIALEEMGLGWIDERKSWRLNERHYGALQGLDKKQTAEQHGAEQVHLWRRSYDVPPPALDPSDERHPRHDARYAWMPPDLLPATECLRDVVGRMLPHWYDAIVPALRDGRRVLVAAHGNSLRALVKHLDAIPDDEIADLNIPTGIPLVYELDADLAPVGSRYLGDPAAAEAAARAVANQAR